MRLDKYMVLSSNEHRAYEFFSEGPKGTIKKVVNFAIIGDHHYNLEFGDWIEADRRIDDLARSNNSDRDKILATIAFTIMEFLKHYPKASIFGMESTLSRTRLYQIGIFSNWHEINDLLIVKGWINSNWQLVIKQRNYEDFLVRLR